MANTECKCICVCRFVFTDGLLSAIKSFVKAEISNTYFAIALPETHVKDYSFVEIMKV